MPGVHSAFPVPVQRQVGGFTVQETRMVNYPYFVDIRPDGMDRESGLMTGMDQLTITWPSPITIDAEQNKDRQVTRLLESSEESWLSDSTTITPDFKRYGDFGFPMGDDQQRRLLAVVVEGRFDSYFAGKPSPLLAKEPKTDDTPPNSPDQPITEPAEQGTIARQIDHSPESARIILISSGSFVSDTAVSIGSTVMRTNCLNPVQMMANAVDWSLEDRGLLSIRGRSHFSRTLLPMSKEVQMLWEYTNYSLAGLGLVVIWFIRRGMTKRAGKRYISVLQQSIGRA
jgi:ABC-2 type transport system permease protein